MQRLVLASTSRYRRGLLARLGLPFEVCAPSYDEEKNLDMPPGEMVAHFARSKAASLAEHNIRGLVTMATILSLSSGIALVL